MANKEVQRLLIDNDSFVDIKLDILTIDILLHEEDLIGFFSHHVSPLGYIKLFVTYASLLMTILHITPWSPNFERLGSYCVNSLFEDEIL
ncbi:hypothetical protein CR513_61863, partial [Mucuna pruriens]